MTPTPTRSVSLMANEKGANVSKFLIALHLGGGAAGAAEIAEKYCRSTPAVQHVFEHRLKGAVVAGTTAASGWAS
jgi:hypothetical protein